MRSTAVRKGARAQRRKGGIRIAQQLAQNEVQNWHPRASQRRDKRAIKLHVIKTDKLRTLELLNDHEVVYTRDTDVVASEMPLFSNPFLNVEALLPKTHTTHWCIHRAHLVNFCPFLCRQLLGCRKYFHF